MTRDFLLKVAVLGALGLAVLAGMIAAVDAANYHEAFVVDTAEYVGHDHHDH